MVRPKSMTSDLLRERHPVFVLDHHDPFKVFLPRLIDLSGILSTQPFMITQKLAKPWCYMTAYSRLRGVHCECLWVDHTPLSV